MDAVTSLETRPSHYDVVGVEVLRIGDYVDKNGRPVPVNGDFISQLSGHYDVTHHRARVSFDHEQEGGAWAGSAERFYPSPDGSRLFADLANVPAYIADEMGERGSWPTRSMEIYDDLDGRGVYPKNVTLLGVRPPAVKGMEPVTADMLRPSRDGSLRIYEFSESDGVKLSTYTYTDNQNKPQEECAMSALRDDPAFKELQEQLGKLSDRTGELETELSEKEAALSEAETQLKEAQETNEKLLAEVAKGKIKERTAEAERFVESLRKERRCTPGVKEAGLIQLLSDLASDTETIQLSDKEISRYELLKQVLMAYPSLGSDKELAGSDTDPGTKPRRGKEQKEIEEEARLAAPAGVSLEKWEKALSEAEEEVRAGKGNFDEGGDD